MATNDPIETLTENLERNVGNWASIRSIALGHMGGTFLSDFVVRELTAAASDHEHIVVRGAGQSSFTFINTPNFEYSARVVTPFSRGARPIKWLGMPQIIGIKGCGRVLVRALEVPPQTDIEQFAPGVQLHESAVSEVRDGDVLVEEVRNQILEVTEVTEPTVMEIVTYRHDAPSLVWTFNSELKSIYCEQSSLTASRLRNLLLVAQESGYAIPADIYDLALQSRSPQVALMAIQSMLTSGNRDGFLELYRAMESAHPGLRKGASELLDTMFH